MTGATLLAALAGGVFTSGLVLLAYALMFPHDRGRPPAWLAARAARLWRGHGRTPAQQRRYRLAVAATVLVAAGTWLVTGLPVLALLAAAAVPGVPWLLSAGGAERRAIARVEAVGEWTRRLRDVAETGAGLQAAIVASAGTAPAAVAPQVAMLAARLQAGGNAERSLRAFADEVDDVVGDQIVAALLLHLKDRGEKLGVVLSSIAEAAAKEVSMRKEADAERASARFAVRFMTGFAAVAVVAAALSGDYLQPYAGGSGQLLMVVLAGTFIAILWWARLLSRPTPTARLLPSAGTWR